MHLWYVVWLLLDGSGERASPIHFISGPYDKVEQCVAVGYPMDYPDDAMAARTPDTTLVLGCVDIVVDDKSKVAT